MADTVQVTTVYESPKWLILNATNYSDGTGEANVVKADISAHTGPDGTTATSFAVHEIMYAVKGGSVLLEFDATTDDEIHLCSGNGFISYDSVGGLQDPQSTGATGDILFTTNDFAAGSTYNITLKLRKKD